jgi:O-antigen/teichoic acid export membrane protein
MLGDRRLGSFAAAHVVIAAASRALAFVGVAAYIRVLGADAYGIYAIALINEQVVFVLVGYAVANAMGKFMSDALLGEVDEDRVVGTAFSASIAVGVVAALAWQVVAAPVARLTLADTADAVTVSRLIGVAVAAELVLAVVTAIWLLRAHVMPFAVATLAQFGGATVIGVALIEAADLGVVGAMLGWTAATLAAAVGGSIWMLRRYRPRHDGVLLRAMLRYGLPLIPGGLLMLGLQTADRYVVRARTDLHETAVYATAVLVATGLGAVIVTAFKRVWTALMWSLREQPNEAAVHRRALLLYAAGQALVLVVTTVYGGLAMVILSGNKPGFEEAGPAIAIVYAGFVLYGAYDILSAGYFFVGRTHLYSVSVAVALVVELAVALALVGGLGFWGAAIANPVAWAVFALLSWQFGRRYFHVDHAWTRVFAVLVCATALGALGWWSRSQGGVAGEAGGVVVVVVAAVACLRFVGADEARAVWEMVRRRAEVGTPCA